MPVASQIGCIGGNTYIMSLSHGNVAATSGTHVFLKRFVRLYSPNFDTSERAVPHSHLARNAIRETPKVEEAKLS